MPRGSRPLVGSSSSSSSGLAQQRGGDPEPLPHAQRVGPHRAPVDAGQPDPLQRLVDPAGAGPAAGRRGPAASSSRRLVRPDRCGQAAGPSTSAPTRGSTVGRAGGIGRPSSLDRARGRRAPARAASAPAWSCRSRSGPSSPNRAPCGTRRSTPSTAVTRPNRLVRPSVTTTSPVTPAAGRGARASGPGQHVRDDGADQQRAAAPAGAHRHRHQRRADQDRPAAAVPGRRPRPPPRRPRWPARRRPG